MINPFRVITTGSALVVFGLFLIYTTLPTAVIGTGVTLIVAACCYLFETRE